MKNILIVLVFIITVPVLAQDWVTYKNEALGFSAYFPGKPEISSQVISTEVGDLTMSIFMVSAAHIINSKNAVYMVVHSKYPENPENLQGSEVQKMLDNSVNGAVANVNGTLVYDNKIELNGRPGREVKIDIPRAYMYINMFVKENTLYAIQTICLKENDNNEDIKMYLSSLKLN